MFALIVSGVLWLIPHLAAASSIGNRMINARAETQRKFRPFKLLLDPLHHSRRRFLRVAKRGRRMVPLFVAFGSIIMIEQA